jgi:antirestriction protein ArdC
VTTKEKKDHAGDAMRQTAEALCEMIEQGMGDPNAWKKSWRSLTVALGGAVNARTARPYTGGNAWRLALLEMLGTHVGPWATFKQWGELGAKVRKDEKATWILVPKTVKRETTEGERQRWEDAGRTAPDVVTRTFFGAAPLFAASQVEGYIAPEGIDITPPTTTAAHQWTADVVKAGHVSLLPGEPAARPASGIVYMPPAENFTDDAAYLTTFWHELTHWTRPHVGRETTAKRWGDKGYAAEELVAEMGAAVIAARHGLSADPRPDHLHYLAHWYQMVKDDPSKLWSAGKLAQEAAAYLFDLVPLDSGAEVEAEQMVVAA